jgi:hypothetical protein
MLPAMLNRNRQTKLNVVWELVPDADPQAIHKAFAMLFGRRASGTAAMQKSPQTCGKNTEIDKSH